MEGIDPAYRGWEVRTRYNRSREVKEGLGLRPCFALPAKAKSMELPLLPELQGRRRDATLARELLRRRRTRGPCWRRSRRRAGCRGGHLPRRGHRHARRRRRRCRRPGHHPGELPAAELLRVEYDLQKKRLGYRRQPCAASS
ncbi:hypothetical protein ACP4OV_025896 [Aristida adscensionis]